MDDGSPTLEVGFAITTGSSAEELIRLQSVMDSTEAKVVAEAAKIEAATGNMIKVGGASAEIKAFGNAATKELENVRRETERVEKSGETMVRQLARQAETFGKTASEIRNMRTEMRAASAESKGLTELAGRLRDANAEMIRLESLAGGVGKKSRGSMTQLSFQLNDVATQAALGQAPMQIFASQAGQIFQLAQMAEGGLKGFAAEIGATAIAFAPFIAVAAVAAGAFALFDRAISKGVDTKAMTKSLGLTHAEIKQLKNTSVDAGDVIKATFQVMAKSVGIDLGGMAKGFGDAMDWMTKTGRQALALLYAQFSGTFRAIDVIVKDVFALKGPGEIMSDIGKAYKGAFEDADNALIKFGGDVTKQVKANKLADLKKQATAIKADRTPTKDTHADDLARDALAVEAQIRNLYALAQAYQVSGAAALIAEARVKAESAAIKDRADIEAAVSRQVALAIAERVADASKGAAALRDQALVQEMVNAEVRSGVASAERASELVSARMADLPLLAAIEAAQQQGLADEARKATEALDDQRAARERLAYDVRQSQFQSASSADATRLAELREELRLVTATDAQRGRALATLRATQEAVKFNADDQADYVAQQQAIFDVQQQLADSQAVYNASLTVAADRWDIIAGKIASAGSSMADAFGDGGRAIGDIATIYASFQAQRARADAEHQLALKKAGGNETLLAQENARFALRSSGAQISAYGDMAAAAKGFFQEGSSGYQAMMKAEQVFRAIQFALSVRAIAQDAVETGSKLATSAARTAAGAAEAVVNAIKSLPFPLNLAAGAATVAALAAIGVTIAGSFGGNSKSSLAKANDGTGTVLGDASAKSESIKRSIDALKEVDTVMLTYSRDMAGSLRSIDNQIGNVAGLVARTGVDGISAGGTNGFQTNVIGSILKATVPFFGSALASLFGTKTTVLAGGLYGQAQSLGSVLNGGFDAQTYSDIEKKKKLLGITTSTSYSTQYGAADPTLENQFTLILRAFNDSIAAAAGPLGESTSAIQQRLNSFVVSIGKIDLQGLTGSEVQEKLAAVFGATADQMANTAFPGLTRFQKVGEGAFETLVRVASTVESVTSDLEKLGYGARALGIEAKLGLANQFDSVSDLTSAVDGYFQAFYTKEEQAAAMAVQFGHVFGSLGLAMPNTLAGFRKLVEAQDLTTAAGQAAYSTLLQLAPAFVELQSAMSGAKTAAEVLSERDDLQRKLLELQGDTQAIRELDLAKLDATNRALQEQVWALSDAQDAAKDAQELAAAWSTVGDSIMDEVRRIRGLSDTAGATTYASLLGQFNAATASARGGDIDAAKALPQLSQSLLAAAQDAATSRQELDRIRAMTASNLEATYKALNGGASAGSNSALLNSAAASQTATSPGTETTASTLAAQLDELRQELVQLRTDNNAGHAANAAANSKTAGILDRVTQAAGGDSLSVDLAA